MKAFFVNANLYDFSTLQLTKYHSYEKNEMDLENCVCFNFAYRSIFRMVDSYKDISKNRNVT